MTGRSALRFAGGGGAESETQVDVWELSEAGQLTARCFSLQSAADPLHLHNLVSRGGLALTVSSIISCLQEGGGDFLNFSMHFIVRVKHHKAGVFESYEKSTTAASFSMRTYCLSPTCFSNADNRTDSLFFFFQTWRGRICHFKAILCSFLP